MSRAELAFCFMGFLARPAAQTEGTEANAKDASQRRTGGDGLRASAERLEDLASGPGEAVQRKHALLHFKG